MHARYSESSLVVQLVHDSIRRDLERRDRYTCNCTRLHAQDLGPARAVDVDAMKKVRTPKQPKRGLKVKTETVKELRPSKLDEVAGGAQQAGCAQTRFTTTAN